MTTQTNMAEAKGKAGQKVEIAPLPYALGAEVRCGDVRTLNEQATRTICQAYLDHLVLLFRDQELSDYELMDFGRRFGQLDEPISSEYSTEGVKDTDENLKYVSVISNVTENGIAIGALGDGEAAWHSDFSFHEVPYSATLLYALEVPPRGGNTGFQNMYSALETLPPDLRDKIKGRTIKHDASHNSAGQLRRGFKPVTDVRTSPGPSHPVVWRHPETKCDALYLGRRPYAYVNGLPLEESEVLLDALWAHATQPRFGWHHTWKVGDILVWDNRCTMHHRDPFDPGSRRIMHKTARQGTRPIAGQGPQARPHPRGCLFT
jgi:taurine dioxygenase